MYKVKISHKKDPLTPHSAEQGRLRLTHFLEDTIEFKISDPKLGKPIHRTINIDQIVREALQWVDTHCARSEPCNNYFKSLGRQFKKEPITLRQILDRKTILVYRLEHVVTRQEILEHTPPAELSMEGYTFAWDATTATIGLNEIALTDSRNLASVFIHEFAHVAGAPGRAEDPKSLAAENAKMHCGFGDLFSKEATGSLIKIGKTSIG